MNARAIPAHSTHAPAPTPSPRLPLYLCSGRHLRVERDGPALSVHKPDKAPVLYPLARLSRIICTPAVHWSGVALSACMQAGAPIVLLGKDGPIGYMQPVQAHPSRLDAALDELLDRPDGVTRYREWLRAERMRVLKNWMVERVQAGESVKMQTWKELVRRFVYLAEPPLQGLDGAALLQAALYAYTLQRVHQAGLRAQYMGLNAERLRLAADLSELLALALRLELEGMGARAQADTSTWLNILHRVSRRQEERLREHLGRLHRHLATLFEEWQ
ncbi:MAG: hypothetical protein RMK60_12340 [Burkholderiales bacterium]|nr:hypothetical protein [Burkholderiales bacterium]